MTETIEMLDEAWGLSPAVALRPEPFGAMAYHFGNRKLTLTRREDLQAPPVSACAENPLVGFAL
jgi:putative mycofactocin binding protein MftB